MDDRRNLFVIIFITFFVMVYVQWMFPQQPQPVATQQQGQQNVAPTTAQQNPIPQGASAPQISVPNVPAPNARPSVAQLEEGPVTIIDTGVALFSINHLGARIQSVQLKNYTARLHDTALHEMVETKDGAQLPLAVYADGTTDDFVLYALDQNALPPIDGSMYKVGADGITLSYTGQLATGTQIQKTLHFTKDSFSTDVNVVLSQPSRDGNPIAIEWAQVVPQTQVADAAFNGKFSFLNSEGKLQNTFFRDFKNPFVDNGSGKWVGMCDYYFLQAISVIDGNAAARTGHEGDVFYTRMTGSSTAGSFKVYAGPKEIDSLKSVGTSLERSVDLGMFSFLAQPILLLMKFFYKYLGNYGLSIILLTLLIKLAFLPLTQSSFKSMQAMQELQPEIKALRERVDDPNTLNQELMGLYKKRGVNPLGGCLPVLIQIPVFLGLYNALLNSIDLRHAPFALWISDLSAPEQLHLFGIGVPLMILIMGASMFVQQLTQPSAMDPQQKKIMMFMPVMFTGMFILHPMPSGLVLYWLVNNLISIVQQTAIRGNKKITPIMATSYASLAMFCFGFLLTLF